MEVVRNTHKTGDIRERWLEKTFWKRWQQLSREFLARVFFKQKPKMTSDCCVWGRADALENRQCNPCHLQYGGETKRPLKDRFSSVYKTIIKSKPISVAEDFLSHPNHCHTDTQLIPLELIPSSRDSIRKARESFLIDLARTLEPHGMNRLDES